jgi:hypothetical protein
VLVRNTKTNEEVSVPRRYLGEISRVDAPVMIVGLLAELEYRAGAVWPAERRVIEMPRAVNDGPGRGWRNRRRRGLRWLASDWRANELARRKAGAGRRRAGRGRGACWRSACFAAA